jgi:hypothetical protein
MTDHPQHMQGVTLQMPTGGSKIHAPLTITLHGTFYQAPDWLYCRHDHTERAGRALLTVRDRCANMNSRWARPPRYNQAIPVHAAVEGQEERLP